jgi:hypothetical protein
VSTTLTHPRVYDPGNDITAEATGSITARRLVAPSGNRTSGGNIAVATATAAGAVLGVAVTDASTGQLVAVARGGVVKVAAGGAISAGAQVEVGSAGKVVALASGIAIGLAVTGASNNSDAEIALYS